MPEIILQMDNAAELEKLYRSNKTAFKKEFDESYQQIMNKPLARFWYERLHYESEEITWGSHNELVVVLILALLSGLVAKVPHFFGVNENYFYPRHLGFIEFPFIATYFAWKNKLSGAKIGLVTGLMLTGLIFINAVPFDKTSDTLVLSCIHLALFLWCITGFAFSGGATNDVQKRLGFLKYNGDLVVMTALILIAGGILSGITVGLFSLIGLNIENWYFKYVAIFGLAAAPIVATFLTQTNPQLVGKVSPVIARLFSPLVLVMLIIYLAAMLNSSKSPYSDREYLIIFNALLLSVLAIIFFSIAGTPGISKTGLEKWVLLLLSVVTIVVNCIALSAILYRIATLGITPNRAAVLGGNILILVNLILVTVSLAKALTNKGDIEDVGKVIASYLPVYLVWTIVVAFLFPFIFSLK